MRILNIAGYKFITIDDLPSLQRALRQQCETAGLMGTILLSHEGINIMLAGPEAAIATFRAYLRQDARFLDMRFHETYSDEVPFRQLKIKLKKEIITFKQPAVDATDERAPSISPNELKRWLDENRDITMLDTRNEYEISFGTFQKAVNLHLDHFSELPAAIDALDPKKPVVMFCTGGIRCEKAAIYLQKNQFSEVYQLDGGILGYFAEVGGAHYEGGCFVFDERISVDPV